MLLIYDEAGRECHDFTCARASTAELSRISMSASRWSIMSCSAKKALSGTPSPDISTITCLLRCKRPTVEQVPLIVAYQCRHFRKQQVYRRRYESRRSSSLNCIKNKNNKTWPKTIFNMADGILTPCNVARSRHWFRQVTASCNVACGSGIVTVNSPSGSTLQCDTWLWDDMLLNSPKRPPYWNSTSGFRFYTSPQSTCHSAPVCKIYPNQTTLDVMSIFKMANLSHLGL